MAIFCHQGAPKMRKKFLQNFKIPFQPKCQNCRVNNRCGLVFSFLALKWPKRAIFGGQGTQKMRFFPFKISKFCFSQSVRIDECIADVVSFSFLFCLKMAIFGGQCSPKMRFSFFKISKFRFGRSIRVEEWIMNMQSFFMARPGAQNDHIKWPKFELKCTKF